MYTPNSEAQLHGSSTEVTYFFVEKPVTVSGNNTLNGYRNIGYTSTDTLSDIGEVNSAAGSGSEHNTGHVNSAAGIRLHSADRGTFRQAAGNRHSPDSGENLA